MIYLSVPACVYVSYISICMYVCLYLVFCCFKLRFTFSIIFYAFPMYNIVVRQSCGSV